MRPGPRSGALRTVAGWTLALIVLVACGTLVAPQQWDGGRGPVVPHDTFPADCRLCHTGDGWNTIRADFTFDHAAETGYALDGAHAQAECLRCHNDRGPVEVFAQRGCAGCHVDPHRQKLGPGCTDCHNSDTWVPREQIAMHARTRMPLVGAHAAAQCFQCHPGAEVGNFEGLDPTCVTCHMSDLGRATAPDHQVQGWTDDCQRCHVPLDWRPARFAHPGSFPLIGGHSGHDCATCHGDGPSFTGLSPECASCHLDEYQNTDDPNHAQLNFGLDCRQCHNVFGWDGTNFQHPGRLALTGGHAGRRCTECHQNGQYAGTPTDCVACHLDEYQRANDPNHAQMQFPQDCTQCHSTASWNGARFDHPQGFPLTSGHAGRACTECHQNGQYVGTPADCVACHQDEYDRTTDPNHRATGYSTSCTQCHRATTWDDATFDHRFPIRGGPHGGISCAECHTVPTQPSAFSCVDCHEHPRGEMDSKHREVRDYSYASPECYRCHPNGRH